MKSLTYKGYQGNIEEKQDFFFGHVLGLQNTIISYEGRNLKELEKDFRAGIDDYLENCRLQQVEPEKAKYWAQ
ncbi:MULTISPECIES: hypothetical protein [Lactobacillus]|uniref:Type II toxin-antitoxin system HicB family antitoxin n=1 Tax=Lactobacillus xujianguonis TaxID=2495899 RepID=A0A437SUG1_9LACO|nr:MULTISPECIES: hypothetical protein [Lactobacillus]RVU70573.1 hypothetical protein EJK17_06690 [Lactobacillus xujianguonis]RVU73802.1 hypothetical protein EJK20_06360 [Lactobacillus xujianguonis]